MAHRRRTIAGRRVGGLRVSYALSGGDSAGSTYRGVIVVPSATKRGETMWRALKDMALRIGNNEDFGELIRGVAMACGWLVVSAILVTIAAIIVSALF
jgi:hypothetical protein